MEPTRSSPYWLSTFVLLCSFLSTQSLNTKIHEHMTIDELRHVFHVEDHSSVPQYHPVHLTHHLARRYILPTKTNTLPGNSGKVPHEKHHIYKTETSPPSLLNDEMFKVADLKDEVEDLNSTVSVDFDVKSSESESDSDSDVHRIELEAFGKPLKLALKKQEGLVKKDGLKLFRVVGNETEPHGVDYEELSSEGEEEVGDLYQDEENGAALLIRRHPKHGKLMVEGSIGHELVIRPVADSMTAAVQDDEMFLDPSSMADMVSIDTGLPLVKRKREQQEELLRALNGAHHVIIKRDPAAGDHESDYAFMEPDHIGKRFRTKRSTEHARKKRDAPYVIYPEILVIVDYDGYRLHNGDNVQIKRYFVSFWNGVDLRYKLLKGPRIRISIAGIIISRGRDATPYLERNRVGRDAIDSAAALTDMGKYLFRERRLPVYDIAVAITKLDMCRRQYANDACNRGTAGFAYVGGACVVNKRLEKVNSVAIIEDTGGFSGIIVAAHEVGHLLGAVHDGSPPPSYLGGPGAEKCRWEDGFIMSDLRHTEKGFRWSPCSVQSFHHFLNGDTATCLYNSPHEDDSLPRVLPGRLLTLDAQCRKDRGTSACFKDERVCAQLFCFDAASGYCVAYRPAAEGSPCGDGQYCINGRCITEHENIIPDYSQHTPSYVRPDTSPFYGNITSYEETTQPIVPSTSTYKPYYQTYKTTNSIYTTTTSTTENSLKYYFYTTKKPVEYTERYTVTQPSSITYPPSFNKYSISTTKSPYDFHDFFSRTTKEVDRSEPKRAGFYSKDDFDTYFGRSTTKDPYPEKGSRSSYKFGTHYSRAKSSDNSIRPDANVQQVQIEPARLVFSYQRNLTSGETVRQ
ncbi:A disintegrin and metalloproteinase with thrombospondin motifs like isoform X1 [Cydia pomonella]|uniref:A disintegrin and metalloproteinase with thrombospondin motifs like isoform X1 n=1 Tax=Cydia pomonella TaxID=82600 RepID=UPI002ADE91D8|nr:A disintegrin and metalloproteinase with thrombospondin motifs like isoform X1 [Cydia pomonella]XP_061723934.1 A disintegrin and metalloproteinase with thrombospondin motifs like isoform X1 [Cydia pomonella]XP_061723935.1 A disintegrin and metalloproteinase with thrombospondin motifs like isoform X1 [Cydia pomonella]